MNKKKKSYGISILLAFLMMTNNIYVYGAFGILWMMLCWAIVAAFNTVNPDLGTWAMIIYVFIAAPIQTYVHNSSVDNVTNKSWE